ncbi:response regulator transcription factor [Streptosporangium minutum]|uniref:response regulator transcription factor n=1 Tax=Streptosporangium minutum TaxID=569862 RepID=UPI003BFA0505
MPGPALPHLRDRLTAELTGCPAGHVDHPGLPGSGDPAPVGRSAPCSAASAAEQLNCQGSKEAAAALFISETTVKTHLAHIYTKLGVSDRAAAVAVGYDRGLLP